MTLDNIIAEIESDFEAYKASGLIDKSSMYRWAYLNLKKFGQSICELTETTITVKAGEAQLPQGFHSLELAAKCDLSSYYCKDEDIPLIQNTLMWKEKVERKVTGLSCTPCCTTTEEKTITENVYINGKQVSLFYSSPMMLKLGKGMKRDRCSKNCRNLVVYDCPHEIIINNNTLYTNFAEGTVYMQYYGIPHTEDGDIVIPETDRGELATYIEYALKQRLIEKLLTNGDDPNLATLLQYYNGKEKVQYGLAMADAKMSTLKPSSYRRLTQANRSHMANIAYLLPKF
jgi:hypothetical protein